MPIKGLTDNVQPSFPRLGVLKKGDAKPESGVGKELPYFRFIGTTDEITALFHKLYGTEPKKLRCYLAYGQVDATFEAWCEVWDATGLVHRCDGETMTIWREGGIYKRGSQPCAGGHRDNDPLRDAHGRLKIILPEMVEAGFAGYIQVNTGGKHDLLEIQSRLEAIAEVRNGDLSGVPVFIERVAESVSTPGFGTRAGQRSKTTKWNIKITPDSEWMRIMLELHKKSALGAGTTVPALPSGEEMPDVIDLDTTDDDDWQIPSEFGGSGTVAVPDDVLEARKFVTEKGTELGKLKLQDWHALTSWYTKLKPAEITEARTELYQQVNVLIDYANAEG